MTSRSSFPDPLVPKLESSFQLLVLTSFVFIFSYLAARLGSLLVVRPQMLWPMWPGCAFLVALLLKTERKALWPLFLIAGLAGFAVYDQQAGLSLHSISIFFLADAVEISVAALGVSFVFGGAPRLDSIRSLAKYGFFAVILAPISVASLAASALGDSGTRWKVSFLTEALALLTLTPAILSWLDIVSVRRTRPASHYIEAISISIGLASLSYFAFMRPGTTIGPATFYSLVPFLLWAALRFGMTGVTSSMIIVSVCSIWGATHGSGPFIGETPVRAVFSLQLFLLFASTSFMVLAALVAEHKQVTQALRESEERFRLVADTAPVLIWMSGTDKLCDYFNRPWLNFTGRPLESELGNGWAVGVHDEDRPNCMQIYCDAFDRRDEFRMEYRLRRYDGNYRWILDIGVPRFDAAGSFVGYIGVAIDVTDLKAAEEVRSRYAAIVESSDDAIIGVDLNGIVTDWNNSAQRVYGYAASEIIGKQICLLTPIDYRNEPQRILQKLLRGQAIRSYETVRQKKDGTRIDVSLSVSPICDARGHTAGVSAIVRDISERKRTDEALAGMSRKLILAQDQERERIARDLHDDFCQRLALLAIDLGQVRQDPSQLNRLQAVRDKIVEVSSDLQTLSHQLHSSKLQYLGLVAAMRSWCKDFGERQEMNIAFSGPDVLRSVEPEIALCLFRVLQEGVSNAAKHSGARRIEVQLVEQNGEIHLLVRDSGRGFNIEAAMHGRGLGLTSMQERVRLMDGALMIESKPMRGTTILARIPLKSENALERAAG